MYCERTLASPLTYGGFKVIPKSVSISYAAYENISYWQHCTFPYYLESTNLHSSLEDVINSICKTH